MMAGKTMVDGVLDVSPTVRIGIPRLARAFQSPPAGYTPSWRFGRPTAPTVKPHSRIYTSQAISY
jgi:hypothetical protein